jgi:lipoate---protein ligase
LQSPHSSISNWRVSPLTIADQQSHIERSEQRLAAMSPGDPPTLYWSQAESVGLVLGYSQKPHVLNPLVNDASGPFQHMPIYHRHAGGTAVLVGPDLLSLDVLLPGDSPLVLPDIVESYHWFGEAWVKALRSLGIETRTVSPEEAHELRRLLKQEETHMREDVLRRACYGSLSPFEVVVGQRKVVGLDMIRRRKASLLQAGVLLHWESETLAQLLGHTPQEQAILREGLLERAVGIDTLAGRVIKPHEVIAAFEEVISSLQT